jgi:GT2 family glycosyltransferase
LNPSVSVIVVNWHSQKHLNQCLEALSRQTLRPGRVIIVDNSADFSPQALLHLNLRIEVISPGGNIGFAAANNLGAQNAQGSEWIALLNPDAFPEPLWLENLLKAAEDHPGFDFFGSRLIRYLEPQVLDGVQDVYHTSGLVWRHKHGVKPSESDSVQKEIFSACAAAALYRRAAFMEAKGFDEDFFCYLEDVDLGFRLRLLGYRCLYVPSAKAYHVGSATTGRHSDFTVYHGHRNLVWTYVKNMPWPLFFYYLPQHLFLNAASLVWFSLKGRTKLIFKAKKDALRSIPGMVMKRKKIQKNRRVTLAGVKKFMAKGAYAVLKRPE